MNTKITELLGIEHPIISGGMVWCSGHRLAQAVSLAGGLGLIGAGSMHPETLIYHIEQARAATAPTARVFGVNVPLFYPEIERVIDILIQERVPVVFTSGGSPALYTKRLQAAGIVVVHVVSSVKFALKAQEAGCQAVVCEGTEAGGHNGRQETTTMVLVPGVVDALSIPVIAAGGIACGAQMLAALALGAQGVQVGTRFALCDESSAHENFKLRCRGMAEGGTVLAMQKLVPIRMARNEFCETILAAQSRGASSDELRQLLGERRSKLGVFEGQIQQGVLEIGQVSSMVSECESARDIVDQMMREVGDRFVDLSRLV
ncbi:MAG: nitronate monooxygenase [Mucinivorans sp.]